MNFLKLVLVVAIGAAAYFYWQHDSGSSPRGFVSLPQVRGQSPASVLVVAAENCPHEDAQRADQLARDLSKNGLPVVRIHNVGFDFPGKERPNIDRINAVMSGSLPIVFVHGRAKANPTLAEVLAEYKASKP